MAAAAHMTVWVGSHVIVSEALLKASSGSAQEVVCSASGTHLHNSRSYGSYRCNPVDRAECSHLPHLCQPVKTIPEIELSTCHAHRSMRVRSAYDELGPRTSESQLIVMQGHDERCGHRHVQT